MWYWDKKRHIDQWNRFEGAEIKLYIYDHDHLTFDKDAMTIQWERNIFSTKMQGQVVIHMQKSEIGPLPQKCITDFNGRAKTVKLLEENIEVNLLGSGFLDMTPKAQGQREN